MRISWGKKERHALCREEEKNGTFTNFANVGEGRTKEDLRRRVLLRKASHRLPQDKHKTGGGRVQGLSAQGEKKSRCRTNFEDFVGIAWVIEDLQGRLEYRGLRVRRKECCDFA